MKYNEIATPRPLQFLMVGVRNDKSGFGQHALEMRQKGDSLYFIATGKSLPHKKKIFVGEVSKPR
ncbi:hypothetical protein ES707_14240 [subsurface metagenome]